MDAVDAMVAPVFYNIGAIATISFHDANWVHSSLRASQVNLIAPSK